MSNIGYCQCALLTYEVVPQFLTADKNLDLGMGFVHEDGDEEGEKVIQVVLHPQVGWPHLEEQIVASRRTEEDDKFASSDVQDTCR